MKISKIFAGMSALAMSAAMFSAVAASADDAPQENGFYNASYSATYTYSGSDLASGNPECTAWEEPYVVGEGDDAKTYNLYNLGFNIQVGHVKNAKVTIEVTSSDNTIWDGTAGVSSGYMYTVQKSWNQDCPADDEVGEVKFTENSAKGATDLNGWDSGPTKYNGQWAQITITDNDLSKLTFTVTFEADSDSKWEYHAYNPDSTEETPNQYQVFCFAGGDSQTFPFELVDCDTINEQFGGVTSTNYNAGGDSSNTESKADDKSSGGDSGSGSGKSSGSGDSTSSAAGDTSSAASDSNSTTDSAEAGSTDTAKAGSSDSSSSSTAAASASSSSSTAAASADSKSSTTSSTAASATKSSTTTTTTTSSSAAAPAGGGSDGSAESDATSNAASGAAAGVGLAMTAVAAAAIVVSKRRN